MGGLATLLPLNINSYTLSSWRWLLPGTFVVCISFDPYQPNLLQYLDLATCRHGLLHFLRSCIGMKHCAIISQFSQFWPDGRLMKQWMMNGQRILSCETPTDHVLSLGWLTSNSHLFVAASSDWHPIFPICLILLSVCPSLLHIEPEAIYWFEWNASKESVRLLDFRLWWAFLLLMIHIVSWINQTLSQLEQSWCQSWCQIGIYLHKDCIVITPTNALADNAPAAGRLVSKAT